VPPPPSVYRPQADQAAVTDRPFVQTNWPNPVSPPPVRQPQPGQGFEIVYKPVMQNDWPLPWFPPPVKHEVGRNLTLVLANVPAEVRSPARWNWVNPWVPQVAPPLLFEQQRYKLPFWEEVPVVAPTTHLLTCVGCGT
jgi:hypothetical protein